jgi:DNA-binding transcriptional ArsR family regulator
MAATKTATRPATRSATASKKSQKEADLRAQQARRASVLLKHVSDPTRLQVILILSEGERHVGALCEQLSQSQPAVSHHLALLRHGGIIAPRRQGKNNFYSLTETGESIPSEPEPDLTLARPPSPVLSRLVPPRRARRPPPGRSGRHLPAFALQY